MVVQVGPRTPGPHVGAVPLYPSAKTTTILVKVRRTFKAGPAPSNRMRRRTLLSRSAVLEALAIAGCIGSPEGEPTTEPEATDPPQTHSPTPSPTTTEPDTPTASPAPTETATDGADQEVTVGPTGDLRFAPTGFQIAVGETVRWQWDSSGHNVRPNSMPDGSDWPGTEGGDSTTFSAGHTYSYTFEVAGSYEYYCAPHRSAGMTGTFTVG